MKISFVVSTRDNLKYLKWSYDSIRKNQGNHEVWICYGIDHCTDGTQEWVEEIEKVDPFVKSIENKTGKRLGHTIMYDQVVNQLVETDLAMIFHSDMYLCPNALDEVERLMYFKYPDVTIYSGSPENLPYLVTDRKTPEQKRIVSLTRIEPSLHPAGYEKIQADFGTEPEEFDEVGLLAQLYVFSKLDKWKQADQFGNEFYVPLTGTTDGIFAPWAFWADEFKEIGGHDSLFKPQSKEDSDIFNRFKLKFGENCFFQPRNAYVYHLSCKGSRWNPNLTTTGNNSSEWERQNQISTRNFIRKWGHFVKHDEYLNPIIPHKYNIGFILQNPSFDLIHALEPWCSRMVCPTLNQEIIDRYVELEQPNTPFNLKEKLEYGGCETDIIVEIDGQRFDQNDYETIKYLSQIIEQSGSIGEFELGNLKITIKSLQTYEDQLIVCKNEPIQLT